MNHCKHFHFDGVMHTPCLQCEIDQLRADNERLKAELAEAKKDAELWREREARIKLLKERGFLGSPLRGEPYKIDMKGK